MERVDKRQSFIRILDELRDWFRRIAKADEKKAPSDDIVARLVRMEEQLENCEQRIGVLEEKLKERDRNTQPAPLPQEPDNTPEPAPLISRSSKSSVEPKMVSDPEKKEVEWIYFEGCYTKDGRVCLGGGTRERIAYAQFEGQKSSERELTFAPISFESLSQADNLHLPLQSDPESVPERTACGMEIVHPGTAVLEEGLWFVSEKAVIRWC